MTTTGTRTATIDGARPGIRIAGTRASAGTRDGDARGITFGGLLRSEWIKLRSLRSTWIVVAALVAMSAGGAALMAVSGPWMQDGIPADASAQAMFVAQLLAIVTMFAQLVVAVFGALSLGGEYATGMIRSTMTAAPRRLGAFSAKAIVLAAFTFVLTIANFVVAYLVVLAILGGHGLSIALWHPDVALSLLVDAGYLVAVTVFAFGIGAVTRSSAGAIAITLGVLLVVPIVLSFLPEPVATSVGPAMLSTAGQQLMFVDWSDVTGTAANDLARAAGVVAAWPAASALLGGILIAKRDV